jgi:hypothetical protein
LLNSPQVLIPKIDHITKSRIINAAKILSPFLSKIFILVLNLADKNLVRDIISALLFILFIIFIKAYIF